MASTGVTPKEAIAFRRGMVDGKKLTPQEREELMKPHLPPAPLDPSPMPKTLRARPQSKQKVRKASYSYGPNKQSYGPVKTFVHLLIYQTIALIFSIFFRFRRAWRLATGKVVAVLKYHHRTPEFIARDVKHLERLPKHLSVILDYHESDEDQGNAGLEGLLNDLAEIAAWTASAGVPYLSVYQSSGILKKYMKQTHRSVSDHLESYFGPRRKPTVSISAPHYPTYSPPGTPRASTDANGTTDERPHLTILLLSEVDGRETMVDLTKTLVDMAQKGELQLDQISAPLIDAELSDYVSTEPDLLILFSPTVLLDGYPPWQLRLTEIFHLPDNKGVNYQVFLRALHKFAKAEMRLGR